MIKSWLIKIEAPFVGTEQYYRAYSKENPCDSGQLAAWFWEEATMQLWDNYGWQWEQNFDEEFEEFRDEFADYDDFLDTRIQEWKEDCSMQCSECPEEEFYMYVPGGEGELEIIYDERQ